MHKKTPAFGGSFFMPCIQVICFNFGSWRFLNYTKYTSNILLYKLTQGS